VARKQIQKSQITGQQGVNLIERIVLEMGFTWTPTGSLEAGIDGYIELRDHRSGEVTNTIIQVQSKATDVPFTAESETGLSYNCRSTDLHYWLNGNAPVILVYSRPSTGEAYWKDVKAYFSQHADTKTIRFDRREDRFDASCAAKLIALGVSQDRGLFLPPPPKEEKLTSSLVSVTFRQQHVWSAPSRFSTVKEAIQALRAADLLLPRDWIMDGGRVYSWHDLSTGDWSEIVEVKQARKEALDEMAGATDAPSRMRFVRLLNQTLPSCLRPRIFRRLVKGRWLYFFAPFEHGKERRYRFHGAKRQTEHAVVSVKMKRDDASAVYYHRSHAAYLQFRNYGSSWFLDIDPTYYFTTNGENEHPFAHSLLSGIKRIEGQSAILGQTRLWADVLGQEADLINRHHKMFGFSELLAFGSELGIDEGAWKLTRDDDDGASPDDVDDSQGADEMDEATQLGLFEGAE
jgi:hypothetical protein